MKRLLALLAAVLLLTGCRAIPEKSSAVPATQPTMEPAPTEPVFDALALTQTLTTQEQVGQLFLARCPDVSAAQDVSTYHLGGYLLFGRDFKDNSPEQVRSDITSYQANATIPLLIAVDEEGGSVCRVSANPLLRDARFPAPRDLYAQGGLELIKETELEKCRLLSSLGINVNASPVCDITTDEDAFMYSRSLGQDPETTGEFVAVVTNVMEQNGIGGILKHFPGYGNNTDTHVGIATDYRPLSQLEETDLVPFTYGISAGCGAIMVSHTVIAQLDPDLPASLSPAVHEYMRTKLHFNGVVVTDDLAMAAITDRYGDGEAAVLAVLSGNDLLCSSNYQKQYAAVLEAVQSGRIPEETLQRAAARVLQWKYDMGLLEES